MSLIRTRDPLAFRTALVALFGLFATLTAVSVSQAPAASAAGTFTATSSSTSTTTTTTLAARRAQIQRAKSNRIITVAQRWVGSRYTWGGSSPRSGFDCSGYVMFVFNHAEVARLPHQSEMQRHAFRMHRILRRNARPGDLIFYMSGGRAYHVAIFDGHGGQYSAVDPQQGVRHQKIYARNIQFRTDWHA